MCVCAPTFSLKKKKNTVFDFKQVGKIHFVDVEQLVMSESTYDSIDEIFQCHVL